MWVDSHCHLNYPEIQSHFSDVLKRAAENQVGCMLTISTKFSEFDQILALAEQHDHIYCTVGVHPHYALDELQYVSVDGLIKAAQHPKVVGLGETGLDYYYENSPKKEQQESLQIHIEAARELQIPLIIHTRDADEDTIEILEKAYREKPFKGLIHCFSTGRELAMRMLDIGFYISLSGIITFKRADDIRDTVKDIPMDRLLVETDCPYLAPLPYRGKPNEPSYVIHTGEKLSEIKGLSIEDVKNKTTENFFRLFDKCKKETG